MTKLEELKEAIRRLSKEELAHFRDWFMDFDASSWDREFEEDVAQGKFEQFVEEAVEDLGHGRCRDL